MIEFSSVTLGYENHPVIKNLTLQLDNNKRYAIIGPSGCGKTTMLYGIAGIIKADEGCITIDAEPIKKSRQETSIILQEYGLFPWKTVWQNISLPLEIRGGLTEENREACHQLLITLGLENKKHYYPSQLSGGQKQRVAIARSWSTKPDLLLMDEPFSSLDAMTREGLQDAVLKLQKESEMTLILVTHSIEEAVYLADNIIVLSEDGHLAAIIDNPEQGELDYRENDAYFQRCLTIRALLKGGRYEA